MVLTTKWSINHGGDCRTSPATPGLLIIGKLFNLFKRLFGLEKNYWKVPTSIKKLVRFDFDWIALDCI